MLLYRKKFWAKWSFTPRISKNFITCTPWKFQVLYPRLMEAPHDFFVITPANSFYWSLEFPHFIFSIPLEIPCPQPTHPVCFFFWNSPSTQLHWQFLFTYIYIYIYIYIYVWYISSYWVIIILFQKLDTSWKKKKKMRMKKKMKMKKCEESICISKQNEAFLSLLWTYHTDPWCRKLQRYRKYSDRKLSMEHTTLLVAIYLYTLVWVFFTTNNSYTFFTQYFARFEKLWRNL